MANVPTGSMTLQDVVDFIYSGGGEPSPIVTLQDCIDDSVPGLFDSYYYPGDVIPADLNSQSQFRGYSEDTTKPSTPSNLSASDIFQEQFVLSWTGSTDNIAVIGYKIYKGGVQYYDTGNTLTTKTITGLSGSTTSNWTVRAYDAAGNTSNASIGLNVTMKLASISMTTSGYFNNATACSNQTFTSRYSSMPEPINASAVIYTEWTGTTAFDGNNEYYQFPNSAITAPVNGSGGVGLTTYCAPL